MENVDSVIDRWVYKQRDQNSKKESKEKNKASKVKNFLTD